MTSEEFIEKLEKCKDNQVRLQLIAKYIDAIIYDYKTSEDWINNPCLEILDNAFNNLALHFESLAKNLEGE